MVGPRARAELSEMPQGLTTLDLSLPTASLTAGGPVASLKLLEGQTEAGSCPHTSGKRQGWGEEGRKVGTPRQPR